MTENPKKSGVAERQHIARRAGVMAVAAGTAGMAGVAFAAPAFAQTATPRHIPTEPHLAGVHAQPPVRSAAVPALTRTVDAAIAKHALHENAVRGHVAPHQLAVLHHAAPHAGLKADGMPLPQPIHVAPHHFAFHHRHHEAREEGRKGHEAHEAHEAHKGHHHADCDRHHKCTCKGQRGPRGPQGAMGAQGAAGMNGLNGLNGAQGPQGATGAQGAQGAGGAGTQGPQGVAGAQGAQGAAGAQGAQGATGAQGAQGAQGGPSNDIDIQHHGDQEIRVSLQASSGKTFVTLPGVGTGSAQDLSGLPGYITGVVDVSEDVHTHTGGDMMDVVIVNASGSARELVCKLNGAQGLEQGASLAAACPAGWQTITFP